MERCQSNKKATVMVQKNIPVMFGIVQEKCLFPTMVHTHGEFLADEYIE